MMFGDPRLLHRGDVPTRTPVIRGELRRPLAFGIDDPTDDEAVFRSPDMQAVAHEAMLVSSLSYYAGEIIRGPPVEPYFNRFIVGNHHVAWDELVEKHKRLLIRAARDHGKSFMFSVTCPIWHGDRRAPGSLIYIFSATQTLAEERFGETQNQLLDNPKLRHLVPPNTSRLWSKSEITLTNRTVIRARGWGVRVRGGHPGLIIADDILDDNALYSETVRIKAEDYFFSVPSNMITPEGQIVVCGTPFHHADVYSKIEATGKYACSTFPALDEKGVPLFPERYDEARLKEKEEEIGKLRMAREYGCRPLTDEASYFPSKLFMGTDIRLPYKLGMPWDYWEQRQMPRYVGVDVAFSAEEGSDYFVIFSIAMDPSGVRWIANIRWHRGLGLDEQKQLLIEENALLRPDAIYVEANAGQRWLGEDVAKETNLPIRLFFTAGAQPKKKEWERGVTRVTMGKHSLDRGVPSLRMSLERRKWRIPRGDPRSIEATDRWIGEMNCIAFNAGEIVSVGEHDDMVMACWFADAGARLGGGATYIFAGAEAETETKPTAFGVPRPTDFASTANVDPRDLAADPEDEEMFDPFGIGELSRNR